ncbi:thioesterase family protein [Aquicoccus porphyridii]|uniref:Thioesterase n=1 Tax=Aquicoccus porphyridii TaxID=1852029 RepID=A0A5A9ZHY2_9RHOB|nr:thioesterase family protein [Aquicoccus porphyridii]KAA0916771.1 thioesterase [Aquicoccus porphyridii]RAI53893.1 thioesterase [Rhodobacteraceae bacterium AsT-22]
MTKNTPFISTPMRVEPDWIDYNGHLNLAFYHVLFDRGVDQIWEELGFGPEYREQRGFTTYAAESHVRYLREIHEGDMVRASFQLLDHDEKRFHFYQELIHSDGWVSASAEGLTLHIDMSGPRVAPMPPDILANIEALMTRHRDLPRPALIGRPIGIRRK